MKDKAPEMDKKSGNCDLSESSSERADSKATRIAREEESDDINENTGIGKVPGPEGDAAGENKVATSIDDE